MKNKRISMPKRWNILLIVSLILHQACTYKNTETFYIQKPIKEVVPPEIYISSYNEYNDTIYVYFEDADFVIESSNQKIEYFRFLIDNEEYRNVGYSTDISGYSNNYDLHSVTFEDGIYDLSIELFTGSGSGSIADLIGAEGFLFSKTWPLVINNEHKVEYSLENGMLKLSWPEYKLSKFKEFYVYKNGHTVNELYRGKSNFCVDSAYTGPPAFYEIRIQTVIDNSSIIWSKLDL